MKTHEHALISLGYAAGVALLSGGSLADPLLYVSALLGGELIDFIDHPLYHLVYQRNDPGVVKARKAFREGGLQAAVKTLTEIEDTRGFKGLLLHNVYALSLVALLCILGAFFLPAPYYLFVGLGAFILHMITDTIGDFIVLGHVDNWLWVLPQRLVDAFGRMGTGLVFVVMGWGVFIQAGFLLATFRWAFQLTSADVIAGLAYQKSLFTLASLAYVPLVLLALYHFNILGICLAGVHKYRLEMKDHPKAVPFGLGSMPALIRFLLHKTPWTRQNFEKVYLHMQADQGPWIIFLAAIIAVVLLVMTSLFGLYKDVNTGAILWKTEWQMAFVLTPVFFALLFGTLVHTTVGEFGGVWGVFLAWIINLILGRLSLQPMWDLSQGYLVFGAALGAWIMGLMGGIVLKGQSRMSMVAFSIEVKCTQDDDCWLNDTLSLVREGLQNGFSATHEIFFGPANDKKFVNDQPYDLMLTPYKGRPVFGEDYHHLRAEDFFVPMLQEYGYVLCDNHLTSSSSKLGKYGWLPTMPRQRKFGKDITQGDMVLEGSTYRWLSQRRPIALDRAAADPAQETTAPRWVLYKSWGEYFDNVVTRKDTIRADVFVYPDPEQSNLATICGLVCEFTSTKEFATVEAEVYTGAVFKQILDLVEKKDGLWVNRQAAARLFYPRISFWDIEMVESIEQQAGLPSDGGSFPRHELEFIRKSINQLPNNKLIPNASADFSKKLKTLAAEYVVSAVIGLFNFNPALRDSLLGFFKGLF